MAARRRSMAIPALLLALSVVPVTAGIARLSDLTSGAPAEESARFFASPLPVTLHIASAMPFSFVGALQFTPTLRRRWWHRQAGILLVPCGLVSAVTGMWMAHFYPWPPGDGEALYLLRIVVGLAMVFAIVRGIFAVWSRAYDAHGAWMMRAYALGMGAGTQVFTHLPWFIFVGAPGEASRFVLMALGWLINAGVAEYVIRRRSAEVTAT